MQALIAYGIVAIAVMVSCWRWMPAKARLVLRAMLGLSTNPHASNRGTCGACHQCGACATPQPVSKAQVITFHRQ